MLIIPRVASTTIWRNFTVILASVLFLWKVFLWSGADRNCRRNSKAFITSGLFLHHAFLTYLCHCNLLCCSEHGQHSRKMNDNRSYGGAPGEPYFSSPSSFLSLGSKLGQWKQEVGPTVWLQRTAPIFRRTHIHKHAQPSPRFLQPIQRTPLYYSPQANRVKKRASLSSSSIPSAWEFTKPTEAKLHCTENAEEAFSKTLPGPEPM